MSSLLKEEYVAGGPRRGFANSLGETYNVGKLYTCGAIRFVRVAPAFDISGGIASMRKGETLPAAEETVKTAIRLRSQGFQFTLVYSGDKLMIRCDEPAAKG